MELIYSVWRKPLKFEPPTFEGTADTEVVRPICTISSCNIIAFSSPTELSDVDGNTWGGHVYVCDLDTPWNSHKVTSTADPVSALEWDNEGNHLLVATTTGDVSVYGQKEYLLNDWTCLFSASFPGEQILSGIFIHNGRRVVAVDKKPDALISEKYQTVRGTSAQTGFNSSWDGSVLVVTGSGLVAAICPPSDGTQALTTSEALRATRLRVTAAATAYRSGAGAVGGGTGGVLVAAVCEEGGAGRGCVRAALVRGLRAGPPALALRPLPALRLTRQTPVSISWCLREEADTLAVGGGTLSLWQLAERAFPVHKLLAKTSPSPASAPDCFTTLGWQQTGAWPIEEGEQSVRVASSRLAVAPTHLLVATPRALHLLARDDAHYVCSRPLPAGNALAGAATPPKKAKFGNGTLAGSCAMACSVATSWLGGVGVCVDSHGQLHVFRLQPHQTQDHASSLAVQQTCNLLEYSLVTGVDWLDVLVTLQASLLEMVYDRFTETYQRQPPAFQQYFYYKWIKIRLALCSMGGMASSGAGLAALLGAGAAWASALAALRPDDRADAALLAALVEDHDQEKTILALESKPECCGDVTPLQALRRLLQRALDVALTALVDHHHHHHHHGYEILSDANAVNMLRRLVVLSRASGRGGDALSRPLARLLPSGGGNNAAARHELQEECGQLALQPGGRAWELLPRCSVSAPHAAPRPLHLEYGVEPETLRYSPEPPAYLQCDSTPALAMDTIRYMYLGGGWTPAAWRECSRCGARALPAPRPARLVAQRAHDGRLLPACRCGGKWTLISNV